MNTSLPCGAWPSPVAAEDLAGAVLRLDQIAVRGNEVWWTEGRPADAGRYALVCWRPGHDPEDALPPGSDVRTRVHEYGGGAFVLLDRSGDGDGGGGERDSDGRDHHDGGTDRAARARPTDVAYVDDRDAQWHLLRHGAPTRRLTDAAGTRFADALHDRHRDRLICVREAPAGASAAVASGPAGSAGATDPTGATGVSAPTGASPESPDASPDRAAEPVASLVAIDLADGAVTVLAQGHDFYASPALSPDGTQLAWLTWDHPDMPWDATTLWRAALRDDGTLGPAERIAGGPGVSVFQPQWSPDGRLHCVADPTGWWNLYRVEARDRLHPLCPMPAEFGCPQWAFAMSTYGFDGAGAIVCAYRDAGRWRLGRIDAGGALTPIETPFVAIDELRVSGDTVALVASTETAPAAVVCLDSAGGAARTLRAAAPATLPAEAISRAEPIAFPNAEGLVTHAFFYPPRGLGPADGRALRVPPGERPPLIVITHGGPTANAEPGFRLAIQFWTTRGFAVVDVDYGGSTGHGRAYRARLDGRWGEVDVDDAIAAARFLAARGDADPARTVIRGSSAGGYTTLAALTFRDFFRAGASHYGIGDLATLARDTHKFESRYLDRLVGPWPAARETYRARSPIHHVERLACPLILFQGREDRVVPPQQAQAMHDAVDAKGLPVALLMFDGEQHGFRRAATIRRVLEAELAFYGRVLGFTPAGAAEPLEIRNLPPAT